MKIYREDGFNAGWRNVGRFALWSIPYMLGAAALVWLGFAIGVHNWFNQLSQEQRRAIYVGAETRPKSKLKIETPRESCLIITRVDLDGSTASVYFENQCQQTRTFINIQWQLISPNGTSLASGDNYASSLGGPSSLETGQKGEAVFDGGFFSFHGISTDNRAERIRFTIK